MSQAFLAFLDPDRGDVRVDVAETYDAAAQVTRGTWYLSTDSEPDFMVAPLDIRSISPQELPLRARLSNPGATGFLGQQRPARRVGAVRCAGIPNVFVNARLT